MQRRLNWIVAISLAVMTDKSSCRNTQLLSSSLPCFASGGRKLATFEAVPDPTLQREQRLEPGASE